MERIDSLVKYSSDLENSNMFRLADHVDRYIRGINEIMNLDEKSKSKFSHVLEEQPMGCISCMSRESSSEDNDYLFSEWTKEPMLKEIYDEIGTDKDIEEIEDFRIKEERGEDFFGSNTPASLKEMIKALLTEWEAISDEFIEGLASGDLEDQEIMEYFQDLIDIGKRLLQSAKNLKNTKVFQQIKIKLKKTVYELNKYYNHKFEN